MGKKRTGAKREQGKTYESLTAFTKTEREAVERALGTLYKRSIFHVVAPRFSLPNLAAVYYSLTDQDVWDALQKAEQLRQPANFYGTARVDIKAGSYTMHVDAEEGTLIPLEEHMHFARIPAVLHEFAVATRDYLTKWQEVHSVFGELNQVSKPVTAAYNWPCVTALMAIGGAPNDRLVNAARPTHSLPGKLLARLRDTQAFVMSHTMLPPITDATSSGTNDRGNVKVNLKRDDLDTYGTFTCHLWPAINE